MYVPQPQEQGHKLQKEYLRDCTPARSPRLLTSNIYSYSLRQVLRFFLVVVKDAEWTFSLPFCNCNTWIEHMSFLDFIPALDVFFFNL